MFGRPQATSQRTHRDVADDWTERLAGTGLPLARPEGRPRPPLVFAAPLPVGVMAEQEYADLLLSEHLPAWRVREAVSASMPTDLTLVGLCDVWVGAPALAAIVVAAEYRVVAAPADLEPHAVRAAAGRLLARPRIERERTRGGRPVTYDLRPLIEHITVEDRRPIVLRVGTRFHPERGSGRPDEIVSALSEALGAPIDIDAIVRERLVLDEPATPVSPARPLRPWLAGRGPSGRQAPSGKRTGA